MRLRRFAAVPLLLLALGSATAVPAAAKGEQPNPAATCGEENAIPVPFPPFTFPLPSRGACASTVAADLELSTAAYAQNCAELEIGFAAENQGKPYPYAFYGNANYEAKNRADCIYFLRAFHTGQLPPGPA